MRLVVKFAFFFGLMGEEITPAHETHICNNLSGCNCENLHILQKGKFVVIVLNRIFGHKRSYFTIVHLDIWSQSSELAKVTTAERNAVRMLIKSHTSNVNALVQIPL